MNDSFQPAISFLGCFPNTADMGNFWDPINPKHKCLTSEATWVQAAWAVWTIDLKILNTLDPVTQIHWVT